MVLTHQEGKEVNVGGVKASHHTHTAASHTKDTARWPSSGGSSEIKQSENKQKISRFH